jgi:hypothetical protein
MDGPGDQLLSRSALPLHEHGGVRLCDPLDNPEDLPHGGRRAQDLLEADDVLLVPEPRLRLPLQLPEPRGAAKDHLWAPCVAGQAAETGRPGGGSAASPSAARSRRTACGSVTAPRFRRGPPPRGQKRGQTRNGGSDADHPPHPTPLRLGSATGRTQSPVRGPTECLRNRLNLSIPGGVVRSGQEAVFCIRHRGAKVQSRAPQLLEVLPSHVVVVGVPSGQKGPEAKLEQVPPAQASEETEDHEQLAT